jgi:hypothetical protein
MSSTLWHADLTDTLGAMDRHSTRGPWSFRVSCEIGAGGRKTWFADVTISGVTHAIRIQDGALVPSGRRAWWRTAERAMQACDALDRRGLPGSLDLTRRKGS